VSEEATAALDVVEDQITADAVDQDQQQQQPQQGAEAESGDDVAKNQDADGV
jgi:hypothetical protein